MTTLEVKEGKARPSGKEGVKSAEGRHYLLEKDGVFMIEPARGGGYLPAKRICARLEVKARVRDAESSSWGLLVCFCDHDGTSHREIIPAIEFRRDGSDVIGRLLAMGLDIEPMRRSFVLDYLQRAQVKERARIASRVGWHGDVYVLPEMTFGNRDEEWIYDSDSPGGKFCSKGTLEGWKREVASLCRGNSRLLFAVSAAFAAPLLHPSGSEGGGFHFRSESSEGKTTALRVAASVCGGPDYLERWRATDNGLEAVAMQHCDAPLMLDELAQLDPKVAGEVAYMLANGSGKARANRLGGGRERASWRILFLSAGEIGLAEHMGEIGRRPRAGQELRLAEIPADAGKGFGIFDHLHHHANGSEFAKSLNDACRQEYGTAYPVFMEQLMENLGGLPDMIRTIQADFDLENLSLKASGQAKRLADRFALVGAAGELATEWGVTGWEKGEAMQAAAQCFRAWLSSRGGEGNQEEREMLRAVKEFLLRYGESSFTDWYRPALADSHAPVKVDRAGYRRSSADSVEYYIFLEVFMSRVCEGFNHAAVARLLLKRGYIRKGTEKDRPWSCRVVIPSEGRRRVIHVLPSIWEDGEPEENCPEVSRNDDVPF
jgi:uncharacterized protein (DUF927 family)